jgi:hypothetical protein
MIVKLEQSREYILLQNPHCPELPFYTVDFIFAGNIFYDTTRTLTSKLIRNRKENPKSMSIVGNKKFCYVYDVQNNKFAILKFGQRITDLILKTPSAFSCGQSLYPIHKLTQGFNNYDDSYFDKSSIDINSIDFSNFNKLQNIEDFIKSKCYKKNINKIYDYFNRTEGGDYFISKIRELQSEERDLKIDKILT